MNGDNSAAAAPGDSISWGRKTAFGFGMLANQLFTAALGVFMVVLVMGLNMDPLLAGILASVPRVWDAVTDPVMGYVSDRTRSRWGRRRPYIFAGAIIAGLSFIFMWQIYPDNSQFHNFVYFLTWSLVFYLGYTIFATPYIALGYEMSSDFHERTRLMAVAQWIGQFAWVAAPWFWVLIYMPSLFPTPHVGARQLSVIVGLFCLVLGIIPAVFCREKAISTSGQLTINGLAENIKVFGAGIIQTLKCIPFLKLCGATFLVFNGFQTVAQFSFFIIVYYLFAGNFSAAGQWPAWFGTLSALSTCFVVIPIITALSQKIGKKQTFVVSSIISIFGYILKWWCFNPANPWLMLIPLPFISFGIGGLFTLMMSMTADVCDLDEMKNGSRREGMFGAVYWWMVKLGTALALLTSGAVLKLTGFVQGSSLQTARTLTQLRLADIIIPSIGAWAAVFLMLSYSLTEKEANNIRQALEKRRGENR